jgi:Ca-activated chloride channel homolog
MRLAGLIISAPSLSIFQNEPVSMERKANYYSQLGLSKDATPDEIKRAYHEAVLRLHPDVNINPGDTELFLHIQDAYEVLSNPDLKADYDDDLPSDEGILPVNIKILYSRSILPRLNEPQLIYTLMSIMPNNDLISASSASLNVCLVLDRSTSMRGPRLDNVKETAIQSVRHMRGKGTLSIVTFSDRAEVLLPAGARREPWEIESAIHLIQSGGGTEIYQGLMTAMAEVHRLWDSSAVNHIILVTDGRTYGDEDACLQLAEIASRQGVAITCLGIGDDWNDIFLDKLAAVTGGSSMYAADPGEINKILMAKIHNLSQVYANNVVLHGKSENSVELNCAFRLQPETSELPREYPIHLGSIPDDGSLNILLEFLIKTNPERKEKVTLFEGRINLKCANNERSLTSMYVNLNRTFGDSPSSEIPSDAILRAVERLTLYRMQEKAYQELSNGDIEPATQRLEYLATRLLSLGERDLSQSIREEISNIQQGSSISARGKKRIKYGTRSLLLSTGKIKPLS